MLEDFDSKSTNDKWHVGKEIPIALIAMMIIQTFGAVWWAAGFQATVTTKLDDLSLQVASLNADKYTKSDAQKDSALMQQKINDVDRRLTKIEDRRQ